MEFSSQAALEFVPIVNEIKNLDSIPEVEKPPGTDYEYMNSLIERVKKNWDSEAIDELVFMFKPLIQYIEERLYQYFGWTNTRDDIESHFLELVYEYDRYFKDDTYKEKYKGKKAPKTFYFPYYIKSKLWFRVSEYLKSFNEPVMNTVRCKICDGRMIFINQSHLNSRKCRAKQKEKTISVTSIEKYESLYGKPTQSERPNRSVDAQLSYDHDAWDYNFKAQEFLKTIREELGDRHADVFMSYYLMDLTQKEISEVFKERKTAVSSMLKEAKLCLQT